jgi:hypothetical protein
MYQEQVEPVTEENLVKLVEEVVKNPEKYSTEAKLLLVLKEWKRQGSAYIDDLRYEVVYGEVEEVTLSYFDEGYPHRKGREVAIIPKTVPTIVRVVYRTNTVDPPIYSEVIYVFTKDGWKRVDVY